MLLLDLWHLLASYSSRVGRIGSGLVGDDSGKPWYPSSGHHHLPRSCCIKLGLSSCLLLRCLLLSCLLLLHGPSL